MEKIAKTEKENRWKKMASKNITCMKMIAKVTGKKAHGDVDAGEKRRAPPRRRHKRSC